MIESFSPTPAARVVAYQLAKCATSVGANYRAACSARSKLEFIAKLRIVVEEAEESVYWLDVIDRRAWPGLDLRPLKSEANELLAIFSSSLRTARVNLRNSHFGKSPNQ